MGDDNNDDWYTIVRGVLIVLLVIVISSPFAMYEKVGWTPFSYSSVAPYTITPKKPCECPPGYVCSQSGICRFGGAPPKWVASDNKSAAMLRFKNCVFTVTSRRGTYKINVTEVLNGMAAAYKGAARNISASSISLDRPLNALSFPIPGFNTSAIDADEMSKASATLTGKFRTL